MGEGGTGRRFVGGWPLLVATAGLIALLVGMGSAGAPDAAGAPALRPNIILISTDDQTVESLRVMANVNHLLAAHGAVFDNSFVSFALCCPSRATWLTGQYSHNHGVVGNSPTNGLANFDQSNTLPIWLQRAGYTTAFIGKYLNGYGAIEPKEIPPGWNEWYAGVRLAYFGHTMNRNGKIVRYGSDPRDYQTDVYARTAIDVIRRHAPEDNPFFLWLSFFAPHHGGPDEADDPAGLTTPVPAPRHRDRFQAEPLPMSPAFNEADVSDKPAAIRELPLLGETEIAAIRESYQQRLESLLAVDEAVGRIVAALRARTVLKHTVIIFTSDNGFVEGEHRLPDGKVVLYEPSIRVPLIVRGPGIRHLRLAQTVANIDVAPTIAEIAGVRPALKVDGHSLLPLLADPAIEWGRDLLLERGPGAVGVGDRIYTAIRTPRYLYAEYVTGERELYDLLVDPYELQSHHGDPAYATIEAELARRLASLRDCAGLLCRRGPALALLPIAKGACDAAARVSGADERLVASVDFGLNGSPAVSDVQAPFEHALTGTRATQVSALVTLVDGRRVTLSASVHAC